ncbi:MAG: hypothetical protein UW30_C0025G0006 [Candidatus Giovannonibacteria bacterium GW2011_GWA2_44_13b]|uniref:Uncharacterized protein n=2 Tax=Candidatus Giovannoniibacteriota TaxID=1752738 RepID=A0A0G1GXZ3_9BACT|nr:MAG: hypothetical protein UW30_C0025G0006 [Candidatus Giovannonibacteria bacterium GW2011_GWA2_44_13b]OGF82843.1 MAG: hypothetical protein A2924_01455 [Candidatus Giovannonibacteria bacterium RIFCSPLOWO2_01_FULL_44_16]
MIMDAKRLIKQFWQEMLLKDKVFTGRELETGVVSFFNERLEVFPPGYSPIAMIEDAFKSRRLIKRGNRYIVI